ncbi:MAG: hypothetical protein RML72_09675 [Bacteroidia bacterium]|nr:hypothetical protein [Bacteroidia bacterium]MDW8159125.1 hypothetical protein [Bacteroidia bacterium]
MSSTIGIVSIALISALVSLFLPWYAIALVAMIIGGYTAKSYWASIVIGFVGCAIAWILPALIIDLKNEGILSSRIIILLQLSSESYLYTIAALISGSCGALASLTGFSFKALVIREKRKNEKSFPRF